MDKFMKVANEEAKKNKEQNFKNGGPFGAVIVKNNKIIAKAHNTVLQDNDPTAHAEINAIRKAGNILKSYDLSDCILYTSCYPCPMCLSAIIWSNIKTVYYGNTKEDAANIGFKDDYIYSIINNANSYLNLKNIDRNETIKLFEEFSKSPTLYWKTHNTCYNRIWKEDAMENNHISEDNLLAQNTPVMFTDGTFIYEELKKQLRWQN